VFYGSAVGGLVGYFAYRFIVRRIRVSHWHMADIVAPCIALGLALGRVGCLLNGCCYGNVAVCDHCPGISFPMASAPRFKMTEKGYQTAAGFLVDRGNEPPATPPRIVSSVDPAVPVNLRPGDVLLKINGKEVNTFDKNENKDVTVEDLLMRWPQGKNDIELRVRHANGKEEDLQWTPLTVPLHPTQIYESVSMLLVMFLLLAYYPLRRQPGAVMVLLIFCYGAHRFVNEMLRTDTPPVAFGLTLSQNISILMIGVGIVLALWLRIKTIRHGSSVPPPMPT
jgi:phosphatidylglycerol---prolipoprotein diacylglyceryl transferase